MKNKYLLGLATLLFVTSSYAGVAPGFARGEAAACAAAKRNVPRNAVKTSGCYCDAPRYEGGDWHCNVDYEYK
ncbi:hypothetical protein RFI36_10130 [Acinetobacter gerneri]|jgi:hypothetical protein|uniref:Uncharacterized protein n=1 Tax=Acinetobacter gerneri TaxID=202952 RepID=A0AAW8JMC1_9GAMM|nr:hypothetical protein [Acinetobacter gerneri]MCH4243015.1 hypothetical protein [Acinetobacter gerneri]MDQ9010094.1 hypothetical protein [Acinetobacter gerneri]MDQ9014301.1 hypothetical protein [Acinetobacter gerneri]MDQ9025372.1 hypothetical protein [Acinetobacter gerneri]MDQ9052753.1 hypothetical protein [Acinetobacter gerneri]